VSGVAKSVALPNGVRAVGIPSEQAADMDPDDVIIGQCAVVAARAEEIPERTAEGLSALGDHRENTTPAERLEKGTFLPIHYETVEQHLPPITRETAQLLVDGVPKPRFMSPQEVAQTPAGKAVLKRYGASNHMQLTKKQRDDFAALVSLSQFFAQEHYNTMADYVQRMSGRVVNELATGLEMVIFAEMDRRPQMRVVADMVWDEHERYHKAIVEKSYATVTSIRSQLAKLEARLAELTAEVS